MRQARVADVVRPLRPEEKTLIRFMSPELVSAGADEDISGYDKKPSWDVAIRYQDIKRLLSIPDKEKLKLKRRAVEGILERARKILGSVLKPERNVLMNFQDFTNNRQRGELDVLATLEESWGQGHSNLDQISQEQLRFESRLEKESDVTLVMDGSLSMNSEKTALLAVAAAVVALCVAPERLALIAFASKARTVKRFGENISVESVIERVLEVPSAGLTNLEEGLKEALKVQGQAGKDHANTILITDGKYTEGKDPTYLAPRFQKLHALKLGRDIAGRALLLDLIAQGRGQFFEARRPHDLPKTMYGAMKQLLR